MEFDSMTGLVMSGSCHDSVITVEFDSMSGSCQGGHCRV